MSLSNYTQSPDIEIMELDSQPDFNKPVPTTLNELPQVLKIDDITSGKIEVNILRNDMSLFLRALASASPSQSQQEYRKLLAQRLEAVNVSIQDYCRQYNRLLPVINLAQIRLGHEVEVLPPKAGVSPAKRK